MNNKILVLPDIHGRRFWKKPCENIEKYDKVIFLGDYLDPYDFEGITVRDAIKNFEEIIEFKKNNVDKVVLLLGNHDMPYFSSDYYFFSHYHCRHSESHHKAIATLFEKNKDFFKIAHVENNILFTHAGVESGWLKNVVGCDESDINKICDKINSLLENKDTLRQLYSISSRRGGYNKYPSCIWADCRDMMWDMESFKDPDAYIAPIQKMKQVFGHTLQAYYNTEGQIVFGQAKEFGYCKMVDTANAYVLNTDNFTIQKQS